MNETLLPALTLAPLVALTAWRVRALTPSGAFAAAGVGFCHLAFGGWLGAGALLAFFGTSTALSKLGKRRKDALGFEKTAHRDALQVLANGGVAALCALLLSSPLSPAEQVLAREGLGVRAAMLGALAAANADTWATEIGSLFGGAPRKITTLKPAPPGESGAVSLAGTLAALAGAALIAAFALSPWPPPGGGKYALAILVGGFFGALFDSLLGATLQAQWRDPETERFTEQRSGKPARGLSFLNNDVVNFLATLFGAAVAGILAR